MKKTIGLVHNQPIPEGQTNWESSADVMAQVEAIETALIALGFTAVRIPFTRDLGLFVRRIEEARISMAFNLCESVDDNPQFVAHPAAVMELLNIAFTGSPAAALMATTDKHLGKLVLQAAGFNTPKFFLFSGGEPVNFSHMQFPVILKPQFQDASIGIDQESVITYPGRLSATLREFYGTYGPIVVEEYIDGREFNISLIGSSHPEVMPVAEIDFSGFPDNLFKIVGYRAKWEPDSIEYQSIKKNVPDPVGRHGGKHALRLQRSVTSSLACAITDGLICGLIQTAKPMFWKLMPIPVSARMPDFRRRCRRAGLITRPWSKNLSHLSAPGVN